MKNPKENKFKVGKVALVGRPNAGKSTLLNNIVGQKVVIVSDKPQTTQSRITAVFEDKRGQIFLRDTPGLFESKYGIKKSKAIIKDAISDADLLVYVMDCGRSWGQEEEEIKNIVLSSQKPFIVVINKIDLNKLENKDYYLRKVNKLEDEVLQISAIKNKGVKGLVNKIFKLIPEGSRDKYVDDHVSALLSQNSQQYIEELVREKIFNLTRQEVPYQTQVTISSIINNETRNILKIKGTITVFDDKYKGMLIGKNGSMINKIKDEVKKELFRLSEKKIYVTLKVTS
jgi:GTPase